MVKKTKSFMSIQYDINILLNYVIRLKIINELKYGCNGNGDINPSLYLI